MGQSCVKGAMSAAYRKGIGSIFPNREVAADGNVHESGITGGGPGKSSLFFLTNLSTLKSDYPEIGYSGR